MQMSSVGWSGHRKLSVAVVLLVGLALFPGRATIPTVASQDAKPNSESAEGVLQADQPVVGNVKADPEGEAKESEQDAKPAEGSVQITVLGPDDKPLAGAKIHAAIWTKEPFVTNRDYVCDEHGKTAVELPKTMDILRLWARKEGHVSLLAGWWPEQEARPRPFPRQFTFRLENGTVIGGIVKNEGGEPIAGVKVWAMLVDPDSGKVLVDPIPNIWLAEHDRTVDTRRTTDAQGRWTLDTAPAGDKFRFKVMLIHPDYLSDQSWGGLQSEQNISSKLLRERTGTIVMRRGTKLSGVVIDADKKVVPDAVVVWGDDPYMQDREYVADTLEQSLPHEEFASAELAAAWSEEIDRRIAAYDRGEVVALDFDAAMEQLRGALAARRLDRSGS